MAKLTIERAMELDTREEFRGVRMTTSIRPDNVAMAVSAEVSLMELMTWAWLRLYIEELAEGSKDLPSLESAAVQLGVSEPELEEYVRKQLLLVHGQVPYLGPEDLEDQVPPDDDQGVADDSADDAELVDEVEAVAGGE